FHAEDGIRGKLVTGVQTCALPIFFVLSFIRDLAALGFPLPLVSKFEDSGNFPIPRVTNRFNLSIRIETVCLGDLFENWRALLRRSEEPSCRESVYLCVDAVESKRR